MELVHHPNIGLHELYARGAVCMLVADDLEAMEQVLDEMDRVMVPILEESDELGFREAALHERGRLADFAWIGGVHESEAKCADERLRGIFLRNTVAAADCGQ